MSVNNLLVANNYNIHLGGLNMGDNKITNVAIATDPTDAVNLGLLQSTISLDKFGVTPPFPTVQSLSNVTAQQIVLNNFTLSSPFYNTSGNHYVVPSTGSYKFSVSLGFEFTVASTSAIVFYLNLQRNNVLLARSVLARTYASGTYDETLYLEWIGNLSFEDIIHVENGVPGGAGAVNITNFKVLPQAKADGKTNNTYLIGQQL